ncbi:class I SAM-dependent methyltransferase [Arachnia propionica]|uniref:Class I SAM-dependent methyltransferase n=1 Tax=Arachnia propionica TaxID=1750 RepID=A0A3P1WWD6_9ACTN|nr:class I SAM-dependent methyltransferase [Arachnia propionica]RRD48693.1 class I SAM-dependent methyltransferase [Arachnia propionica]
MTGAARYTHGHMAAVLASHASRTAQNSAAHLLPHLQPGQRVLDVGCGPATITADLAELVAPGEVIGLDNAEEALDAARATLRDRGVDGVQLVRGDVYELLWPDEYFDVVHAHQVLQHLPDPVAALKEMLWVTRPGGIVAVRDAIYSAMTWYPQYEGMRAWQEIYIATARANGGEPDAGSHLKAWCREAGFDEVTASASTWCYSTDEERSWWAETWAQRCLTSFGPRAVELGLASHTDLECMAADWRRWGEDRDGWFAVVHGEVLARAE